jgi:virulence factor Mce-like protein
MQKQAPSLGRIIVAAGFALSCFGLILFLWVTFGGPIPLKPKSYRVTAYFPEATALALESDVRIGGVSVGKVKSIELAPADVRVNGRDTTAAEIEIEPEFAPISDDARALLRQKTLLGETYVELTAGTEPTSEEAPVSLGAAANLSDGESAAAEPIPEGGELGIGQVREATQFDEILNALDEPTREAGRRLVAYTADALRGRGLDLNDALGNFGPFLDDAAAIASSVRNQRDALGDLIRDTGLVLDALAADDRELAGAVTGAEGAFGGFADAREQLAESVAILPTFEREATATVDRLDELTTSARPLVRELLPVASDVSPTLASIERLSPELRDLFYALDPLLDAAGDGFPALRDTIAELRPVLRGLDPFLANLNPVVRYLYAYRGIVTGFLANPNIGLSGTLGEAPGQPAPRHALRILSYLSAESLAVHTKRLATNRGNGYVPPTVLPIDEGMPSGYGQEVTAGALPNFDCKNTDYGTPQESPDEDEYRYKDGKTPAVDYDWAGCIITRGFIGPYREFGGARGPQVLPEP